MQKTVCAVIVTYNRLETLKTALDHILNQTVLPANIIIVDNNSHDGTREYLANFANHETIRCLYMKSNVGSAGAIAAGMEYGVTLHEFDYFWVLDDDTFYEKNALAGLIMNMEQSDFALLGLHGAHIRFGKKIPVSGDIELQEADYALIDGALIKTSAIQHVGPVNEHFFMMCDDHEFSMRLRKNGYRIGVLKSGADNRLYLGGQGRFTNSTLWRGYYSSRNHILIIKEYFSFVNLIAYIVLQTKLIVSAAVLAPDRYKRVKIRLMGIWHGIRGIGGKTLDPGTLKFDYSNSTRAKKVSRMTRPAGKMVLSHLLYLLQLGIDL